MNTPADGSHDFDFLIGMWHGANHRLIKPLTGSDEWEDFPGELVCRPVFGGAGRCEEVDFPTKGFAGLTLRLFDSQSQEWSLHWVSSRSAKIEPPVVGRWTDGVGDFQCDDTYDGRPIRVRYRWTRQSADQATMEQSFSVDGGQSWEANWVNVMTRQTS